MAMNGASMQFDLRFILFQYFLISLGNSLAFLFSETKKSHVASKSSTNQTVSEG